MSTTSSSWPAPYKRGVQAAAAIALVAGIGLGVVGRGLDHLPNEIGSAPSAIGGPWLVTAFLAALLAACLVGPPASRVVAPLVGSVSLATGAATYYAIFHFVEDATSLRYAVTVGATWALAGMAIGAAVGALAAHATRGGPEARTALASLGGLLLGEAILLLAIWRTDDLQTAALAQLIAGAGIVLAAVIRPTLRPHVTSGPLAWASAVAVTGGFAAFVVREALRATGWAGA